MPLPFTTSLISSLQDLILVLSPSDVLCVLAGMAILYVCRRAGMWIYALTALPGTLAHELAHFIVAFVLGAQPRFPSLIPERMPGGWRLGSVAFRAGRLRALPIAMAPLVLAPFGVWWAAVLMHPTPLPWYFLHAWIAAALLTASLPSKMDFKLAWPGFAVLAMLLLIAVVVSRWT